MSNKTAALPNKVPSLSYQGPKSTAISCTDSPSPCPRPPTDEASIDLSQDYLDSADARLHGLWDERMKDKGGNGWPHERTAVLLISWHESMDELKVEEEVQQLHTTFASLYNYAVTRRSIMPDKLAQVQITKYLADFVYENDSKTTLLIIYYAGHGIGGTPGKLVLTADSQQRVHDRNSILWHQVENTIRTTLADVFVIFDCCFAGNLARGGRGQLTRSFEFMAACNWQSITRVPGKDSFTSALIWALEEFEKVGVPFTTTQLQNKIVQEAPHFPKDQFPILDPRDGRTDSRRLRLGINKKNGILETDLNTYEETVQIKEVVDLRVCFPQHPDNDDIEALSDALKALIESKQLKAQGVQWLRLQKNPTPEYLAQENLMHYAAFKWRRSVQNKKAGSIPALRISTVGAELEKPPPTPSPSSVGDPDHLVPERLDAGNSPKVTATTFFSESPSEDGSIYSKPAMLDCIP